LSRLTTAQLFSARPRPAYGFGPSLAHHYTQATSSQLPKEYLTNTPFDNFHRLAQLKGHTNPTLRHLYGNSGKLKPKPSVRGTTNSSFGPPQVERDQTYHLQLQLMLGHFLRSDLHWPNAVVFNRCVEHWARCLNSRNGWSNESPEAKPELDHWLGEIYFLVESWDEAQVIPWDSGSFTTILNDLLLNLPVLLFIHWQMSPHI
jgi:hypothetical protein